VTRKGDQVEVLGRDVPIRGDLTSVPSGSLEALLRPEDLDVAINPNGLGVVNHRSFLGATTRIGVGIGGSNLRVDVRSSQADDLEMGTRVDVSVNARDVLVTTPLPVN
jgi:ABC-type Fe3+/spermidine/putrescine transport system ATPase subunit